MPRCVSDALFTHSSRREKYVKIQFNRMQKAVLWGIVLAYTGAYLNRLNLSAALGSIASALSLTDARAGMLQSAFALVYAAGQLLNGAIVDRVNPVKHMLIGIVGFCCVNMLMSFAAGFEMLFVLCLFNGAFQSMLWTPIVRIMALYFEGKEARAKANIFISLTLVMGHLGAWAISGIMANAVGWNMSFRVPAVLGIAILFICRYLFRGVHVTAETKREKTRNFAGKAPVFSVFMQTGFGFILLSCILYGFVRDGIVTWAPTLLATMGAGAMSATFIALIIPLINTLGILAGKFLNARGVGNTRFCVALMLLLTAAFCLPLPLSSVMVISALLMGFACAGLYGLNPLLTALIPLEYDKVGRIGLAAGLVDSFIYIGSALAGVLGGTVSQHFGANGLFVSWMLTALLSAALCFLSGMKKPMQALENFGK